ncbi:ABC transporter substrate-binding protein [Pusillimonas sp. T2]|uniref:ABC transporter substrate-binding protein n=1 Tax=Pusillimonas sp. T2 TaxID=1548123 RepID=UPI0020B1291F|nr:penicillin-binding protein activator [Pusillimonas sp. T2]
MMKKMLLKAVGCIGLSAGLIGGVHAQEVFKIGLVLPLTGPFSSIGKQAELGARLYLSEHADKVAGKKVEVILKDDTSVTDVSRRLTQDLVVNDKVDALAGFLVTPAALAAAAVATKAKVPMVTMNGASSSVTRASPFVLRSSFTVAQAAVGVAEWAPKNGITKVVTLVSDYAPGADAEKYFSERFTAAGGQVLEKLRVPLQSPDFAPFLQKARDLKPDALFVFVPAGANAALMKQFVERGMDKAGIRLIGTGDITDDDIVNSMGDVALGVITSHHYSVAHDSPENRKFVEAFKKANNGLRPNFMALQGYDGMRMIFEGAEVSKGQGGEALLKAMKSLTFESPRGPFKIDTDTRELIQNIYIRKVEKVDGELYNIEFETIKDVKDPVVAK